MEALQMPVLHPPPFRLRPWGPADMPVVQDAARDPLIPLITTVPALGSQSEALAFIERQHRRLPKGSGYSFAISNAVSNEAVRQISYYVREGLLRSWQDVGGERKDMYVYSRLWLCP